ncbi:MAG TPA: beta-phosphoglucomutase family hydrolase [Candidatus Dormibacteraeota bacterium]|nr:beta-phosphoglucomutase family hydrolase [Candidatus Dormibacteraeota bacterium]
MAKHRKGAVAESGWLGLPAAVTACLFDLDGVLTQTASVHARAWKTMFDAFLKQRAAAGGSQFKPFDKVSDYDEYVDGKPRADGVRSFLASRHIEIPEGGDSDPPGKDTVHGLGNRKDRLFLDLIHRDGVKPYEGSVRYLHAVREAGLRTAVVSSSKNCSEVLKAAKLVGLFDGQVDGKLAEAEHLKGKPAPDTYLRAARMLGAHATESAVYEDALAGVEAGRAGGFGLVVGVNRTGQAAALRAHGADVVVSDLADLMRVPR